MLKLKNKNSDLQYIQINNKLIRFDSVISIKPNYADNMKIDSYTVTYGVINGGSMTETNGNSVLFKTVYYTENICVEAYEKLTGLLKHKIFVA